MNYKFLLKMMFTIIAFFIGLLAYFGAATFYLVCAIVPCVMYLIWTLWDEGHIWNQEIDYSQGANSDEL